MLINWNSLLLTSRAIDRVKADLEGADFPYEIVVVDNGSKDPGEAKKLGEDENVKVVRLSHNSGFVGGMNTAASASRGEILFFLNNDAYPTSQGAVVRLVETLRRDAAVAAVGPVLLENDTPNVAGAPHRVDWVHGAALMIRRQDFLAVGGFDPVFFIYHEEVLLARILRDMGRTLLQDPSSSFYHVSGTTVKRMGYFERFLKTRNYWILYKRSPRQFVKWHDLYHLARWFLTGMAGAFLDRDSSRLRIHLLANWWGVRAAIEDPSATEGWRVVSRVFPDINAGAPVRV